MFITRQPVIIYRPTVLLVTHTVACMCVCVIVYVEVTLSIFGTLGYFAYCFHIPIVSISKRTYDAAACK